MQVRKAKGGGVSYPVLDPREAKPELRGICALAVMAKAPRPGKVKTRLSPPLTPVEAAALNVCFLSDTAGNIGEVCGAPAQVSNARPGAHDRLGAPGLRSHVPKSGHGAPGLRDEARAAGMVCYTPVGDEAAFEGILPEDFCLIPQRGEGFGDRLLAATEDILVCGFGSVCLIDSDSPTLPGAALRQAVEELARPGDRVVLGGSDDGGYYLIGMKRAHKAAFERIAWSTASVYEETVERVRKAGIELVELPVWYDVDDAATLAVLEQELLEGRRPAFATVDGYDARATREFLQQRRAMVGGQ